MGIIANTPYMALNIVVSLRYKAVQAVDPDG
jgi:hypothetical protein